MASCDRPIPGRWCAACWRAWPCAIAGHWIGYANCSKARFDVLYVVGGGVRNEFLCQFTANACGVPVVAGPVEATAIGNAALQAVALGDLGSLVEARDLVCSSFAVKTYEPRDLSTWDGAYARFLAMTTIH